MPGQVSGIKVYGEQRGCALADYDGDGRVDLAVTQNNGQTRLFHNVTAKPGLRVKLAGPAGQSGRRRRDAAAGLWRPAWPGAGSASRERILVPERQRASARDRRRPPWASRCAGREERRVQAKVRRRAPGKSKSPLTDRRFCDRL